MAHLCTTNAYRQISRWVHEAVLDRMEQRLNAKPEILKLRRQLAEHPFGSIKQWMNQGAFLMRGLEKVRAEFSLMAVIIAQAMNHGNLVMARTSDMPYHVLEAAYQQYLRQASLQAAN